MSLITSKLIIVFLFTLLISMVETLAYATRLSGVRVGLIASALSLFNMIVIVSRLSTMIQQPLTGKLISEAPLTNQLAFVKTQYHMIVGATTIGTGIGILLLPTFIAVFSRGIIQLAEERGSVVGVAKKWINLRGLKKIMEYARWPKLSLLQGIKKQNFPRRLFVINVVVTAVYTVGVLSALYASLLEPKYAAAAIMSSGIINGIATILLTVFIDPKASVLADRVAKKQTSYINLKGYSIAMVGSKLLGTVVAQFLLIPGALYIAWFSKWI